MTGFQDEVLLNDARLVLSQENALVIVHPKQESALCVFVTLPCCLVEGMTWSCPPSGSTELKLLVRREIRVLALTIGPTFLSCRRGIIFNWDINLPAELLRPTA